MVSELTRNMRSFILHEFFFPNSSFGWFLFNSSVFPRFSPISSCDVGCVGKTKSGKSCRTPIGNLVCNKLSPHVCQFFLQFSIQIQDDSMIQQAILSATSYHFMCASFFFNFQFWQTSLQQTITSYVPVFFFNFNFGHLVCNKLSPDVCRFFYSNSRTTFQSRVFAD